MASSDATAIPIKNQAFRVIFPILDADGDLVTGATGLDSEISKDQGTFADCTNEATEIATSSGMYYLDLTSTEMNADCVAIIVKTSSSGAKTTPIVMYPAEAADIKSNVVAFGGTAGTFSGGRPEVNTTHAAGTAWGSGAITAASIASDAITAAKIASGAITSAKFASGAIDATALAADAGTEIAAAVWDRLTSALSTANSIGKLLVDNVNATVSSRLASASYTAPLDAAGTRSAVGLASANLDTQIGTLATPAQVNAEVLDVLSTDTFGEPTGVPGATITLREKIGWLYMALRNRIDVTSSKKIFYDDGGAAEWEKDLSDDGTTYSESEGNAP